MTRLTYFDGLRGLACIEVVLFHYSSAFWPSAPIGLINNGEMAVSLFFLMSGFVLMPSFEKLTGVNAAVARGVRLSVPAFAAVCLAAIICRSSISSTIHVFLSQLTFGFFSPGVVPSLDPPLWTIAVELWGSVLIISAVLLRRASLVVFCAAVAASVVFLGTNELTLFVVGAALSRFRSYGSPFWGVFCVCAGSALCGATPMAVPGVFCGLLRVPSHIHPQTEIGSILIFFGVMLTPALQKILDTKIPCYMGRISFSVYLLHFPILAVVGNFVFLRGHGTNFAAVLALCAGLFVTVCFAELFNRYCDIPAINAAGTLKGFQWSWPAVRRARVAPLPAE